MARGSEVIRYNYLNADGAVVYTKCRVNNARGKNCWYERPDGSRGLNGVQRVLFNLPEVRQAIADDRWVLLCEGEKCCVLARELGFVATTGGGSADWSGDFCEQLRGARVAILPDRDDAGRRFAKRAAQSLVNAAEVRLVEDYLEEVPGEENDGADIEQFRARHGEHSAALLTELINCATRYSERGSPIPGIAGEAESEGGEFLDRLMARQSTCKPSQMDEAAFTQLPGRFVRLVEEETEACREALLVSFLAAAGVLVGRGPYVELSGDPLRTNLHFCLVGSPSRGRKGTSFAPTRIVIETADALFLQRRVLGGIGSGEAIIDLCRDGDIERGVPPAPDKRLLIFEPEFASVLRVISRPTSILSETLRKAADGGTLHNIVKGEPRYASDAHVGGLYHITPRELASVLDVVQRENGLASRILFVHSERSRLLPFGGTMPREAMRDIARELNDAVRLSKMPSWVRMNAEAAGAWPEVYVEITKGLSGTLEHVLARSEAYAWRLMLLYAVLDKRNVITLSDLRAAMAILDYSRDTAECLFGSRMTDPDVVHVESILRGATECRMTFTELRDALQRNWSNERRDGALAILAEAGRIKIEKLPSEGGGRPVHVIQLIA